MIGSYIKQNGKCFGAIVLLLVILCICFLLYQVPLTVIWYPVLIWGVFFFLFCILDFIRFRKRHEHMERLNQQVDQVLEQLPVASNLIEEDYNQLIDALWEKGNKQEMQLMQKLEEYKEYITLWSHQIKTPVTAMGLQLQALEYSGMEKQELTAKLIEIEQYVDTTLQFMRLDEMSHDLVLKEINLAKVIKKAVKYHSRSFILKHLALNMELPDLFIITDEKWLEFVLKQILSNALKYTKKGSITIRLEQEPNVTIVIEDTGIGISSEDLPRICEKGYTGYNGRLQKKATGIGLYLSKTVIEKLGGRFWIESTVDVGTKVYMQLNNLTNV